VRLSGERFAEGQAVVRDCKRREVSG